MDAGLFLWGALIGFWWGGWFADRRAEARSMQEPTLALLYTMVNGVIEQRKFVGPGTTITSFRHFPFRGEQFTLSVQSEGAPPLKEAA